MNEDNRRLELSPASDNLYHEYRIGRYMNRWSDTVSLFWSGMDDRFCNALRISWSDEVDILIIFYASGKIEQNILYCSALYDPSTQ